MANNAASFALQIDRELAQIDEEFGEIVKTITLEGFRRLVIRTPVKDGRARGNWTLTIGVETLEVSEDVDLTGAATIAAAQEALAAYPEDSFPVIYIQNNVVYIEELEDGSSTQAPNGMLAVTLAELNNISAAE